MGDVSKAIQKYITDNIKLTQTDISSAANTREWFLERIANEISRRTSEPRLYSAERFVYFGSYFKGTKVQSVDEYDVLVVLDSKGITHNGWSSIGDGLGTSDPNYLTYYSHSGGGLSSIQVLNWLKKVTETVVDSFGGQAPLRNGQAITAIIKTYNLSIDLVPALVFNKRYSYPSSVFYTIPRGDVQGTWIATSPKEDISQLQSIAATRSNFKNVIRIIKRIKEKYNFLVSSFAIEAALVNHMRYYSWHNDLYADVVDSLFRLVTNFNQGVITDPFEPQINLIGGVNSLSWYAERLTKIGTELMVLQKTYGLDQDTTYTKTKRLFENE